MIDNGNHAVIIIASQDDVHARAVASAVEQHSGWRALILNSADFPTQWNLTVSLNNSNYIHYTIQCADGVIEEESIAGVWARRLLTHWIPPEVEDDKVRRFCIAESRAAFNGWLHGLGSKVLNPLSTEIAATHKPFQLMCAVEVGLTIPTTLISNCPADAATFIGQQEHGAIFKAFTGTSWRFTETRAFEPEHAEHLDKLVLAPALFQEKIERGTDVRVTIVDEECFAVQIDPSHPAASLDWRLDLAATLSPYTLPREIRTRLLQLMRRLGLRFGAVDMRVNPLGEHVFFEVNPGGQFLFCEIHAGQPISNALATALMGCVSNSDTAAVSTSFLA